MGFLTVFIIIERPGECRILFIYRDGSGRLNALATNTAIVRENPPPFASWFPKRTGEPVLACSSRGGREGVMAEED
jgi:hypothetical protein